MSDLDVVKTPDLKKDISHATEDQKDHSSDLDGLHSASKGRNVMSPAVESFKNIQFIEPAEGTPAALALAANAAIKVSKFEKGLHKFRNLKRPKMKSLNIVKKINKTTKNKRKKRHFSKNFKGKVIDGVHELYTLTAGMMLGINHVLGLTVHEEEKEPNREAAAEDFNDVVAVPFPAKGSTEGEFITPPHKLVHTFNFKSYAPRIFSKIRHLFDVDVGSYQQSVCGDYNYVEFISNSKSGQFFFYSHDGRYMLKTQTKEENKFLLSILPQYYEYLRENPNSLLVRILGMHRINMYHLRRKVHFVIMASVFDTPAKIHSIYDLKGSLAGREATEEERENGGVLKDMDLLKDKRKFHLGPKKKEFISQLRKDAEFLAELNIMDYSLLVGVHYRSQRPAVDVSAVHPVVPVAPGTEKAPIVSSVAPPPAALPHSNLPFRRGSIPPDDHGLSQQEITHGATGDSSSDTAVLVSPTTTIQAQRRASSRRMSTGNRGSPGRNATSLHNFSADAHDDSGVGGVGGGRGVNLNSSSNQSQTSRVLFPEKTDGSAPGGANANSNLSSSNNSAAPSQRSSLADGNALASSLTAAKISEEERGHDDVDGDFEEGEEESDGDEYDYDGEDDEFEDIDEGDSDRENENRHSMYLTTRLSGTGDHVHLQQVRKRRPWTDRVDLGINSRSAFGRGDEIYFVGVIDILQQYNVQKRFETMVKGIFGDVRKISAIDAPSYGRRFVKFMDENTD